MCLLYSIYCIGIVHACQFPQLKTRVAPNKSFGTENAGCTWPKMTVFLKCVYINFYIELYYIRVFNIMNLNEYLSPIIGAFSARTAQEKCIPLNFMYVFTLVRCASVVVLKILLAAIEVS